MPKTSPKHGTRAGYDAELIAGNVCDRCRAAKRVYQSQYTKANRAKGIKYTAHQVIDHLDKTPRHTRTAPPPRHGAPPVTPPAAAWQDTGDDDTGHGAPEQDTPETGPEPSMASRLGSMFASMNLGGNSEYIGDEPPDYLHSVDPDPEPSGDWEEVADGEDFVINAAGMRKIEDTLGTYLSIVGMTVEMIDPYCGAIAAENMGTMVNRWSKVIAHYPKAANLFLETKGGTLMAWMAAMQATWPLLYAVYEHHLSKTVKVEDGVLYRRDKAAANGAGRFDPTMPPMPDDFKYTAN